MSSIVKQRAQTSNHTDSYNDGRSSTQMSSSTSQTIEVKCILIGDSGVGKTSLVVSYTTDDYPAEHKPSALDTYCVQVCADNRLVNLQICDTGGGLDIASLRQLSYPGVHVVLLCFSVVQPSSFRSLRTSWLEELVAARLLPPRLPPTGDRDHHPPTSSRPPPAKCTRRRTNTSAPEGKPPVALLPALSPALLLVGCACDLRNDIGHLLNLSQQGETPVDKVSAEALAQHVGAEAYVECSALTQKNLKTVFDLAIWCGLRIADNRSAVDVETRSNRMSAANSSLVAPGSLRTGSQSHLNGVRVDANRDTKNQPDKPAASASFWRRYLCLASGSDE